MTLLEYHELAEEARLRVLKALKVRNCKLFRLVCKLW